MKTLIMKVQLHIVSIACKIFLPEDLWIGKRFGAYTQKYNVVFGKLDDRGVLQGVTMEDIVK